MVDGDGFQKVHQKRTKRNIFKLEAEDKRREAFWTTVGINEGKPYSHKGHMLDPVQVADIAEPNRLERVKDKGASLEASTSKGHELPDNPKDQGQEKIATTDNDTRCAEVHHNHGGNRAEEGHAPLPIK